MFTSSQAHRHHLHHLPPPPLDRNKPVATALVTIFIAALLGLSYIVFTVPLLRTKGCKLSFGEYRGSIYSLGGSTAENECLLESKWMRVARHKVLPFSSSSYAVISDWLYIDYHDRINVLLQIPDDEVAAAAGPKFLVFEQTKYSLEHRTSLAVIGGIVEPGESPDIAAAREVQEEAGRTCQELIPLGRFRTDVNRGMGWVHGYLGVHCGKMTNKQQANAVVDEVGEHDTERQDELIVTLAGLTTAAREGKFLEVQWSNTVALALLHPRLQQWTDS